MLSLKCTLIINIFLVIHDFNWFNEKGNEEEVNFLPENITLDFKFLLMGLRHDVGMKG